MSGSVAEEWTARGMNPEEAERKRELLAKAEQALAGGRGRKLRNRWRWFVPGRIEVFGKHTDYAGGRSLLAAVERGMCVAAAPREDSVVRVMDARTGVSVEIPIGAEGSAAPADWTVYPRTVVRRLARNFAGALAGADVAFASDLPASAGLSSSSTLVTAIFTALARRNGLREHPAYVAAIHSPEELAGYLGAVENGGDFGPLGGQMGVGTFGGSEDHTAILCCQAGRLSQFSFCPVTAERVIELPREWSFVVAASGVAAEKTGGARESYNRAAEASRAIVKVWRAGTAREDVTVAMALASASDAAVRLRALLRRSEQPPFSAHELVERFEQFYEESEALVPAAGEAVARGDMASLGELAARSQAGAERGLKNQTAETIELVRLARELGAGAASAFGAGFGGSVWALAERGAARGFCGEWERAYRRKFPRRAEGSAFFYSGAGSGMLEIASVGEA